MRSRMWLPILVFIAGVSLIIAAAATGNAEVQLFIIFPLISGTSWLFILGVVLIIASFVLGFAFAASSTTDEVSHETIGQPAQQGPQRKSRYGGVVMVGPVPIIFGSDRKMTLLMMVLAVILIVVVLAVALLSF